MEPVNPGEAEWTSSRPAPVFLRIAFPRSAPATSSDESPGIFSVTVPFVATRSPAMLFAPPERVIADVPVRRIAPSPVTAPETVSARPELPVVSFNSPPDTTSIGPVHSPLPEFAAIPALPSTFRLKGIFTESAQNEMPPLLARVISPFVQEASNVGLPWKVMVELPRWTSPPKFCQCEAFAMRLAPLHVSSCPPKSTVRAPQRVPPQVAFAESVTFWKIWSALPAPVKRSAPLPSGPAPAIVTVPFTAVINCSV